MRMTGNTILLTGGSSGIGRALAVRLLARGNQVIVTGRREPALTALQQEHPALIIEVNDAGRAEDRAALAQKLVAAYPRLNIVINNAGIQRKIDLLTGEPWSATAPEIAINLEGPIHFSMLFLPHLARQAHAVLANVSSGLAFVPLAAAPVYSATKAALHSFTQSLRYQARQTGIQVVEIIPPAVRSNLGGAHDFGVPTDEYADSVMEGLAAGQPEVTYQFSRQTSQATRVEQAEIFARINPP